MDIKQDNNNDVIKYFEKIAGYRQDYILFQLPKKFFEKLSKDLKTRNQGISSENSALIKALKVPECFLSNGDSVFNLWKNENALSDALASLIAECSKNNYLHILKNFLFIGTESQTICSSYSIKIERERSYKVDRKECIADISIEFENEGKIYDFLIEHKIKHSLSKNQIRKYKNLTLSNKVAIIYLSSKDKDLYLFNKFKKNLKKNQQCHFHFCTHHDLFVFLMERLSADLKHNYGFLLKWLLEIIFYFRSEKCISSNIAFIAATNTENEKKLFFNQLLNGI